MKIKLSFIVTIFSIILSCGGASNQQTSTGSVTFQLGNPIASKSISSKSVLAVPSKVSINEAKSIVISIEDSKGKTVVDTKQLNLYNMNGAFISEPVPLNTGEYKLAKYLVLDASNNVIYATPITGSAKAYLVQNPLPITFAVSKDQVTTIAPEIVEMTSWSPRDYGYVTFTFNIVPTLNFMVAVFISENDNFHLTSATIAITTNNTTIYDGSLSSITNTLQIKDVSSDYIVVIKKSGYEDYCATFSAEQMKKYGTTPLVVTLSDNGAGYNVSDDGASVSTAPDGSPAVIINERKTTLSYTDLVNNLKNNSSTQTAEMKNVTEGISNSLYSIVSKHGLSSSELSNSTVDVRIVKGYRVDSIDRRFVSTKSDGKSSVALPAVHAQQIKGKIQEILSDGFKENTTDKAVIKDLIDENIYADLPSQVQQYTVANHLFLAGNIDKIEALASRLNVAVDMDSIRDLFSELSRLAPNVEDSTVSSAWNSIKKTASSLASKFTRSSSPNRSSGIVARAFDGDVRVPDGTVFLRRTKTSGGQQGFLGLVMHFTHSGLYSEELSNRYMADPNNGNLIEYLQVPCVLSATPPTALLQTIDDFTSPDHVYDYCMVQPKGWNANAAKYASIDSNSIYGCSNYSESPATFSGLVSTPAAKYDLPYLEALNGSKMNLFWIFTYTFDYGDTSHNLQADHTYCTKVGYTGWKRQGFDIDAHEGPGDLIGPDSVANSAVDRGYWIAETIHAPSGDYTDYRFVYTKAATTNLICSQSTGWLSPSVFYKGNRNTIGTVPVDPTKYTSGLTATVLGNIGSLQRDGYTFAGWNTAFDGSGTTYAPGAVITMGKQSITLYAMWTPVPYSVTYYANGATGGSCPIDSTIYNIWQVVTIPSNTGNLTRVGYSFVGWNTAADGSGTSYTQGNTLLVPSMNISLYAQWSLNPTYTVTYNGNGNTSGLVPVNGTAYEQGSSVTVSGNTGNLVRSGYSFAGWNTAADGSGTAYIQGSIMAMGSANVILYAMWTTNPTYAVTYSGNGNTGGTVPVDTGNYEAGFNVTVLGNTGNLVKTGYTFSGWCVSPSGVGTTYAQGSLLVMGTSAITLYASWSKIPTYNVTYNSNGATGGIVPIDTNNYENGNTVTVLGNTGNLIRTGFTFAGWNTAADGSGTTYSQGSSFAMNAADVPLYAVWTPNATYTVTYNSNGATGGIVPVDTNNYESSNTVVVLGNTGNLVRSGYNFAGWNTAADGSGTTYAQGGSFNIGSQNVILYAVWTSVPTYKVIYDGNGNTDGSVPIDTNNYLTGQTVTVMGNPYNLTKGGRTLLGWNTQPDGSGTEYAINGTFAIASSNVTLYAHWSWLSHILYSNNYLMGTVTSVHAVGSTIYAATNGAGLYISPDNGNTWVNFTTVNGLGSNQLLTVNVVGNTIYVGTTKGLSISTNGGSSWANIDITGDTWKTVYAFAIGSNIYAGTGYGLYVSQNNGSTWKKYNSANGLPTNSAIRVFATDNTIYVATFSQSISTFLGGLSISRNGGSSWTNYSSANGLASTYVTDIYAIGNMIYVATCPNPVTQTGGGVSISTDGGLTWSSYTTANGLGSDFVRSVYAIGNTIYAGTDGGLSISTNNGNTWTNFTTANGLLSNRVRCILGNNNMIYIGMSGTPPNQANPIPSGITIIP